MLRNFLAGFSFARQKICFRKMYGICCFSFFFLQNFAEIFAEISIFLKESGINFQKRNTIKKSDFSFMCLHLSVISFLLTSQAAAFETFSRGVFGIIVWHNCLKKQIHKSEMMVSVKKKHLWGLLSQPANP